MSDGASAAVERLVPGHGPIRERLAVRPAPSLDHVLDAQLTMAVAWLRAVEQAGPKSVIPHLVEAPRGTAVCFEAGDFRSGLDPTTYLLGRLAPLARRLRLSLLPALVCAPYRGHMGHLPCRDRAALLDYVEALADRLGLPIHFPRVLDEDEEFCRLLIARGYNRTAHEPVAMIDVVWDSSDDYLASLRRSARSNAKTELRRNRIAGVSICEIDDVASSAERIHQLVNDHNVRRNGVGVPFGPAFLPALKASLSDRAVFYGAIHAGELVGISVALHQADTVMMPFIGLDERRGEFTYFNLAFYRPIADAIAAGRRRLFLGTMLYEMKARRGCRILPTSFFHRGGSTVAHLVAKPLFAAQGWWARRHKFAQALALTSGATDQ
jgi:Acetyltransferase (GNAT) domain